MNYLRELLKGNTDCLLLSLINCQPMYGYQIIKELRKKSSGYFQFKEGLIYPRLHEMERQGFVRSEWQGRQGTRRRKFYEITDRGRRRLVEERQGWRAFAENVNRLLGVEQAS